MFREGLMSVSQTIPKNYRGRNTLKLIIQGHYLPDTKTQQRSHTQKKKITGQCH